MSLLKDFVKAMPFSGIALAEKAMHGKGALGGLIGGPMSGIGLARQLAGQDRPAQPPMPGGLAPIPDPTAFGNDPNAYLTAVQQWLQSQSAAVPKGGVQVGTMPQRPTGIGGAATMQPGG